MPLKSCNVDGKSGFKWGEQGHCYTGPDGKKKAIKQGVVIEGPGKFKQIMDKSKASFIDHEGLSLAREVYKEMYPRGSADEFLHSVAKYFSKSEDGITPEVDDTSDVEDGENSNTGVPKKDTADENTAQKHALQTADLDTKTEKPMTCVTVPPYNEEASPETDPNKKVPNYTPPSREEMGGTEAIDEDDANAGLCEYIAIAFISTTTRDHLDPNTFCGPNSTFPLRNQSDLTHIAQLLHHAQNPSEVKRQAIRRANHLGLKLPHTWQHDPNQVGS